MSDTPKTDAAVKHWHLLDMDVVSANMARTQERTIAELVEALKSAKWCIDGLKVFGNDNIHKHDVPKVIDAINAAIERAKA